MRVKLNRQAIGQVLRGDEVRRHLRKVAEPIRDRASSQVERYGAEVYLEDYTTDRAAVAVMLDHPNGVGIEGRNRVLAGAAESQGLRVSEEE